LASRRQTDQSGTAFSDLAIFGFNVTAIMAVGQIGGAVAHRKSVALQTNFIDVFWRMVSDRLGAIQRGGSKPEAVVGGGSRCDGGVLSTGGGCPRSARSVPTLGHIKDRTSSPLPPRWKTSGLT